jgi:hypothetical protein
MTPQEAYHKCKGEINKDLEPFIIKNPYYALSYAKVMRSRWIEAEDIISTNSQYSYLYAYYIIKGKLPENMHNMMLLHADKWAKLYFNFIKNEPQP